MRKNMNRILALSAIVALCAACGKADNEPTAPSQAGTQPSGEPPKPVTLRMYQYSGAITDDEFRTLMAEPVKQKYPHITMEIVRQQTGVSLQDALFMGDTPDLIFPGSGISNLIQLQAIQELSPLISKNKFQLERIEPAIVEAIKNQASKAQQLYALPFSVNFSALFYNQDIFDRFGVSYPKDRMTWDEAIEVGKRVARTENGVTYQPLNPSGFSFFQQTLQQALADPVTHKATLSTPAMANALRLYKSIADLPGNKVVDARNAFLKDRIAAMIVDRGAIVGELDALYNKGDKLNWNMTTVPSMKEYPGIGQQDAPFLIAVHANSKHADDAFLALSVILSDENQLKVTRSGRLSALKDTKFKTNFGESLESLKGKNITGAFSYKSAVPPRASEYAALASTQLTEAANRVVSGAEDVNTALTKADELANQKIAAELAAKK